MHANGSQLMLLAVGTGLPVISVIGLLSIWVLERVLRAQPTSHCFRMHLRIRAAALISLSPSQVMLAEAVHTQTVNTGTMESLTQVDAQ
jgi:hypothetical protein